MKLYRHLTEGPVDTDRFEPEQPATSDQPALWRYTGKGRPSASEWELYEPEDSGTGSTGPGTNETDETPAGEPGVDEPAHQILPDGPDSTDQPTPSVVPPVNNGSSDTATSNEGDQPEDYTPTPPGPGAPDAPTISSPEDGADVTGGKLVITGTGTNGNLVYLEEGEGQFPVQPATVADGAFRFVIALEPGEHELSVRQRNAAGDTSDPSDTVTVNIEAEKDLSSIDDPDEKLAQFLRQTVLTAPRLGWDLFAELQNQANAWLDAHDR